MTNNRTAIALVTSLFFLWGIANSLNGVLISHFQLALDLKRWQAGLVDSAFYFGYFVFAIPAEAIYNARQGKQVFSQVRALLGGKVEPGTFAILCGWDR